MNDTIQRLLFNGHHTLSESIDEVDRVLLVGLLATMASIVVALHARFVSTSTTNAHRTVFRIAALIGIAVLGVPTGLLLLVQIAFWDNCGNGCYPNMFLVLMGGAVAMALVSVRIAWTALRSSECADATPPASG